jgi:indole-3-glycerol phosphate synthase
MMRYSLPTVLAQIKDRKEGEVERLYASGLADGYKSQTRDMPPTNDFHGAVNGHGGDRIKLIAEFKRASPYAGWIRRGARPDSIGRLYEECGAAAISVVTDEGFRGSLDDLRRMRKAVALPILRKDFIIDEMQNYESRCNGADAILLIAALLEPPQISDYAGLARELKMDYLVECHSDADVEKTAEAGARLYGFNNRNLRTGAVDLRTTRRLLASIPLFHHAVTESGIFTRNDVEEVMDPRVTAMLVGEGLMSKKLNPTAESMRRRIKRLKMSA